MPEGRTRVKDFLSAGAFDKEDLYGVLVEDPQTGEKYRPERMNSRNVVCIEEGESRRTFPRQYFDNFYLAGREAIQ